MIVLDFSRALAAGTNTILTVRWRTDVPILVVRSPKQPELEDCRIAGAADCIAAPVDIVSLNQTIQRIVRVRGRGRPVSRRAPDNFRFAALSFYPGRNLLNGSAGNTIDLTTSEARLLTHFVSRPWAPLHAQRNRGTALWTRALGRRSRHRYRGQSGGVVPAGGRTGRRSASVFFISAVSEGVVRDPEAGVAWLRRAVEVGDPEAQTALGTTGIFTGPRY